MLVQLGARTSPADLADLFLECHHRIRTFLAMAIRVTESTDADERRVAATQIHRYFTTAFPLHLADEAALARELADLEAVRRMESDHVDHAPAIDGLVAQLAQIMRDPAGHAADANLARAVREAIALLEPHLALEESVIFPAVRQLPAAVIARLRDEMRARRVHD